MFNFEVTGYMLNDYESYKCFTSGYLYGFRGVTNTAGWCTGHQSSSSGDVMQISTYCSRSNQFVLRLTDPAATTHRWHASTLQLGFIGGNGYFNNMLNGYGTEGPLAVVKAVHTVQNTL